MKRLRFTLSVGALLLGELRAASPLAPQPTIPLPRGVSVDFSADGADVVGEVAKYIGTAQREVLLSYYLITDIRVLQALASAHQRGIVVAVLLDRSPAVRNYDTPRYLRVQGIPVILARRGLVGTGWHNQRYIVIDREAVVITSADLTLAAAKNSENILVVSEAAIAIRYFNSWVREAAEGERMP